MSSEGVCEATCRVKTCDAAGQIAFYTGDDPKPPVAALSLSKKFGAGMTNQKKMIVWGEPHAGELAVPQALRHIPSHSSITSDVFPTGPHPPSLRLTSSAVPGSEGRNSQLGGCRPLWAWLCHPGQCSQ